MMTFEVGAVLEDEKWQAPVYCFDNSDQVVDETEEDLEKSLMLEKSLRAPLKLSL